MVEALLRDGEGDRHGDGLAIAEQQGQHRDKQAADPPWLRSVWQWQ